MMISLFLPLILTWVISSSSIFLVKIFALSVKFKMQLEFSKAVFWGNVEVKHLPARLAIIIVMSGYLFNKVRTTSSARWSKVLTGSLFNDFSEVLWKWKPELFKVSNLQNVWIFAQNNPYNNWRRCGLAHFSNQIDMSFDGKICNQPAVKKKLKEFCGINQS